RDLGSVVYIIGITVTLPADPAGAVFEHPGLNFLSLTPSFTQGSMACFNQRRSARSLRRLVGIAQNGTTPIGTSLQLMQCYRAPAASSRLPNLRHFYDTAHRAS